MTEPLSSSGDIRAMAPSGDGFVATAALGNTFLVSRYRADGTIEWRATQRLLVEFKAPEVIITLSPTFDVLQRTVDDHFVELHEMVFDALAAI